MATTGHETEAINVRGLKTALQKMKTDLLPSVPYYVTNAAGTVGTTTSGAYNRTQWSGSAAGISTLYTGAMVLLKVPVKGVSRGVTLNINSLGEHPVLLNASTNISTAYPVGAIIPLVYDADQTASVYVDNTSTEYTGCWKIANYDSNTTYKPLSLGFCIGQCDTAAATKAKTVTMEDYALVANGIVSIKFTEAITVASATLNINSKGAKAIYYKGAAIAANVIQAGDIVTMQYSTQYHIIGILRASGIPASDLASAVQTVIDNASSHVNSTSNPHGVTKEQVGLGNVENKSSATIRGELTSENVTSALGYTPPQQDTTYTPQKLGFGVGVCSTAAVTTAKEVAITDYNLVQNGFVAVTFQNDVPANSTLNINSKGAKAIYYKGAAIEAGIIKAGDTALFAYDGTNYVMVSSGNGESVTGTIIVNLESYVNDAKTSGSDLVGVVVTLTNTSDSEVVGTHTIALGESSVTFKELTPMKNYTVSVSSVAGYTQPSAQAVNQLGIGATVSKTFQYEADEYTVSISSNQGSDDTDISGATVAIAGSNISDGGTKKVEKGTSINPTASDVTGYAKAITTSGKTVSVVYSTEVVEVTCSADDSSSVAGQTITINGTQYTLGSTGVVIAKVAFGTQYSIVASQWTDYRTPATQTYTANQVSRSVSMEWNEIVLGAFVEATDGTLYTSSQWPSSGKTANSVVVIGESHSFRIGLDNVGTGKLFVYSSNMDCPCTAYGNKPDAQQHFDGAGDTDIMKQTYGTDSEFAAGAAYGFVFPDGQHGYLPSLGEFNLAYNNKNSIDDCLRACNKNALSSDYYWTSTKCLTYTFWGIDWSNGTEEDLYVSYGASYNGAYVRAFRTY